MAWPKLKKPRSSAPPVTREHNGLHVIVTPAEHADPDRHATRDAGTSGAHLTGIDGASGPWPVGTPDAAMLEPDNVEDSGFGDSAASGFDDDAPGFDDAVVPGFEDPEGGGIDDILGPADAGPATGPAARQEQQEQAESQQGSWSTPQPVVSVAPGPDSGGGAGDGAGRPRRQRVRDLPMDARMRIWRRRALITVIAGVVFSIIFTWRLGLTIAVIVAIADTIYRSRTVASIPPGIKLTGAQRRTQRQLARTERYGYRALHSRPIPHSEEFIDHLVIGPTGVYAIDSEAWDKRLPIRTRNGRQLWHGPTSKKDRLLHARWEAEQASELLSGALGKEIVVRPAMAVYGPKIPWDVATIRDVDVFSGPRLRKYLRKRARMRDLPRLSEEDVEKIHKAAMSVLPLAGSNVATTPVG
jgi:Nuclease-related domain